MRSIISIGLLSLFVFSTLIAQPVYAAEATLPTPKTLPSSTTFGKMRYWAKWQTKNIQRVFIFSTESKADFQAKRANEKLAETNALIKQGKTELAKNSIADFKDEISQYKALWQEVPQDKLKDTKVTQKLAEDDKIFTSELAVVQNTDMTEKEKTIKDVMVNEIKPIIQNGSDTTSDLKNESPLPPNVLESLQNLLKQGILEPTDLDIILAKKKRTDVRSTLESLSAEGSIPPDMLNQLDIAKVSTLYKEDASQYSAYSAIQALKSISMANLIAPPTEEQLKKIAEFQQNYKPGTPIPEDIKKYIIPQLYGLEISKNLAIMSQQVKSSVFSTEVDKNLFESIKNQVQFTDSGSEIKIQDNKFIIPKNFDPSQAAGQFAAVFANFQSIVQSEVARQVKMFQENMQQKGPSGMTEDQFRTQFAGQIGFNPKYSPPGFKPQEFVQQFDNSIKPVAFGFNPNQFAPSQGQPGMNPSLQNYPQPPSGFGFQNFVKQIENFKPEEAKQYFAPPPPGQQWQPQPNQAQFAVIFIPQDFRPPQEFIQKYEQSKDQFTQMANQARTNMPQYQDFRPPDFIPTEFRPPTGQTGQQPLPNQTQPSGQLPQGQNNTTGSNPNPSQYQPSPGQYVAPPSGTNSPPPNQQPVQNQPQPMQTSQAPQPGPSSQYQPTDSNQPAPYVQPPSGTNNPPPGEVKGLFETNLGINSSLLGWLIALLETPVIIMLLLAIRVIKK